MTPRQRYRVTGHYVTVRTATSDGVKIVGFHTNAVLPPDVPEKTIAHLLSVRLIAPLQAPPPPAPAPVVPDGKPPYDVGSPLPSAVVSMRADEAAGRAVLTAEQLACGDEPYPPSPAQQPAATDDIAARRADAAAKLAAAGGTPDRRHGLQVWAEYAVACGYDRATAEAATKDELVALLADGEQG